jgi:hypothetical protein
MLFAIKCIVDIWSSIVPVGTAGERIKMQKKFDATDPRYFDMTVYLIGSLENKVGLVVEKNYSRM